jgi:hypothetical protein
LEPDYSNYSVDELHETLAYIDKEQFPERAAKIQSEIKKRSSNNSSELAPELTEKITPKSSNNKLGPKSQIFFVLSALLFFYLAVSGLINGEIIGKRDANYSSADDPILFYSHLLFYFGVSGWLVKYVIIQRKKNVKGT